MKSSVAEKIAKECLKTLNPDMWNGKGQKPLSVSEKVYCFDLTENDELDISLRYDEQDGDWEHYCEIVDKTTNTMTECLTGYGIDSLQNLIDTIMVLCEGF